MPEGDPATVSITGMRAVVRGQEAKMERLSVSPERWDVKCDRLARGSLVVNEFDAAREVMFAVAEEAAEMQRGYDLARNIANVRLKNRLRALGVCLEDYELPFG